MKKMLRFRGLSHNINMMVLFLLFCFACGVEDKNEVKIGGQVWTTQNLNVDKFRNGDVIPQAISNKAWVDAWINKKPAWCYYNNQAVQNDPENGENYGKLYNWYAVIDPRGLAPKGYHIPTDDEWTILTNSLGGQYEAGIKMKSESGWLNNGAGNNDSGFSGLPGGSRNVFGDFNYLGRSGGWWSITEKDSVGVFYRGLGYDHNFVNRGFCNKIDGLSVRCIAD